MNTHVRAIESGNQAEIARLGSVGRLERGDLSVQAAHAAGVPITLGTDAGVSKHGENATEFAFFVRYGMTPMEAIVAGTLNSADLLDIGDKVGSLEPGKFADIVVVSGARLKILAFCSTSISSCVKALSIKTEASDEL